jgi:protein-disulfide isomerase
MSKHTGHKTEGSKKRSKSNIAWIIVIIVISVIVFGFLIYPAVSNALTPIGEIKSPAEIAYPTDKVPAGELAAGDPDAPVKLEVYADFQCPACGNYAREIEPLVVKNYVDTGKVYLVFRNYSFIDGNTDKKESHHASEAALCAMDQGAFWQYHAILFANQTGENVGDFTQKRLVAFAEKLGLDTKKFQDCLNSSKYSQRVLDEYEQGKTAGVDSTPSFFINGVRFKLQTSYNELFQALDNAIAAKQK